MPKALCVTKMFRHAPFLVNWFHIASIMFFVFIVFPFISFMMIRREK